MCIHIHTYIHGSHTVTLNFDGHYLMEEVAKNKDKSIHFYFKLCVYMCLTVKYINFKSQQLVKLHM